MRFGVDIPNFGAFADVRFVADLARQAEALGWDGFFIWDHSVWGREPLGDHTVMLTAIALATERIRFGTMITPLARRRPWKFAREMATLDQLSGGRLIVGVGLGGDDWDFANFNDAPEAKERAARLDEGLDIVNGLWQGEVFNYESAQYRVKDTQHLPRPLQRPRIPVWIAGQWPNKAPMRRAARWDGMFPIGRGLGLGEMMSAEALREAVEFVAAERGNRAFDIVHWGITTGDPAQDAAILAPYADVGVTWWLENVTPWVYGWDGVGAWPLEVMRERILAGPPKAPVSQ